MSGAIHPLLSERTAGVLLHPTSLPSRDGAFGIGDLGPTARRFCDWIRDAGLRRWQMLPIGPVGAGDATKSINNVLNSAHLLLATEGMLALKRYGVEPSTALEAINGGSGMSLQTTRLPDNVPSRKFAYGFALGLMRKDCKIAGDLVASQTPSATLIPRVVDLLGEAEAELGPDADYTQIAQLLENRAGLTLG